MKRSLQSPSTYPSRLEAGQSLSTSYITLLFLLFTLRQVVYFGIQLSRIVTQPRPLSFSHGRLTEDMRPVNQNYLDMPDHNDFIPLTVLRGSRRQSLGAPQLRAPSPPYPLYDEDEDVSSENIRYNYHSTSFRQPTAEYVLRPQHPLRPPPVEEHNSDQNLPVVELDSYLQGDSVQLHDDHPINPQLADRNTSVPRRPSPEPGRTSTCHDELVTTNECSQSESLPPSDASLQVSQSPTVDQHARVQSIDSDMYQPALGGLHKISEIQRKDSKRNRFKRAMSRLNPLRCKRRSGRGSRR